MAAVDKQLEALRSSLFREKVHGSLVEEVLLPAEEAEDAEQEEKEKEGKDKGKSKGKSKEEQEKERQLAKEKGLEGKGGAGGKGKEQDGEAALTPAQVREAGRMIGRARFASWYTRWTLRSSAATFARAKIVQRTERAQQMKLAEGWAADGRRAFDACKKGLLFQRDSQFLVGFQQFGIHIIQRFGLLRHAFGARIVVLVLKVDGGIVHHGPIGLFLGQPTGVCLQPPLGHPRGLLIFSRDQAHDVLGQAQRGIIHLNVC